jgi:hypothetical protein
MKVLTKNMAVLIGVAGDVTVLDTRPTLEEAQKMVQGYVELRSFDRDGMNAQALFNEEGLRKELQINMTASVVVGIPLVGPVILLTGRKRWEG